MVSVRQHTSIWRAGTADLQIVKMNARRIQEARRKYIA